MNDGGPAFPSEGRIGDVPYIMTNTGMTLLDWFAGMALLGIMRQAANHFHPTDDAKWCYQIADAMLAQREKAYRPLRNKET